MKGQTYSIGDEIIPLRTRVIGVDEYMKNTPAIIALIDTRDAYDPDVWIYQLVWPNGTQRRWYSFRFKHYMGPQRKALKAVIKRLAK